MSDSDIGQRLWKSYQRSKAIYIPPHRLCAICGTVLHESRFQLCAKCSREYGFQRKEWPAWVKFLVSEKEKERYRINNLPDTVPPKEE